jgi:hypothetical protein
MNNRPKYLVVDTSSLLYRTFFANKNEDELTASGLAHHSALITANKYYRKFRPEKMVFVFDRSSWRKKYTKSEACLSKKLYKGNRHVNMTPREQQKFQQFMEHIKEFEQLLRQYTSCICLARDLLEADDLIAGFVEKHHDQGEIVVLSTDSDLIQLLRFDNTIVHDPSTDKDRTLEQWGGDVNLFVFEKCLRGDLTDNVQSAYPRVRSTKIKQAYEDQYTQANLMNETWTNQLGVKYRVGDLFEENQLLMDLTKQPDNIRQKIFDTIELAKTNVGHFSHFHFLKHCGKYQLKNVANKVNDFVHMLSK